MDGCPRQNPAYRLATARAPQGALAIWRLPDSNSAGGRIVRALAGADDAPMRKLLVPALLVLGLAAGAAPASAGDLCVAPDTPCGGTNVGDLQTALDLAAFSDNADRVFLGATTYTA